MRTLDLDFNAEIKLTSNKKVVWSNKKNKKNVKQIRKSSS